MDAREFAEGGLLVPDAELQQVIEVAETPRDEPEACDAEERI